MVTCVQKFPFDGIDMQRVYSPDSKEEVFVAYAATEENTSGKSWLNRTEPSIVPGFWNAQLKRFNATGTPGFCRPKTVPLAEHFWGSIGCWPQPVESAAAKPKVVIEPIPGSPVDIDTSAYPERGNQSGLSPD